MLNWGALGCIARKLALPRLHPRPRVLASPTALCRDRYMDMASAGGWMPVDGFDGRADAWEMASAEILQAERMLRPAPRAPPAN
jgi:hypothetical protein